MPYFKGVYFEKAFHTEEDVVRHNESSVAAAEPPVQTPEAALEALEVPEPPEPDLAVPVDRETPIVEMSPAVDAEPDPFPSFVPEKDPDTQPAPESKPAPEVNVTPAESPDAKKKRSGRGGR